MAIIKVLPREEAQKIAAGEVVERPASVVKEMIENSIDAGATQISLYIQKSGKQLIRVTDNGNGMHPDDARLCFLPHATSKIRSLDDLESIASFGFRGEALATISAVSKITLITKHKDYKDELGIKLKYELGKFIQEEKVAASSGTDLQVHDLFYNTPVRKKFLKQDETEWNQIQSIFHAFCLSNLSITFKLYRDERLILNAPKIGSVKDRVAQIWGHNFAQNLIEMQVPQDDSPDFKHLADIKFSGFISNHNFWRYGRNHIFFFVNNRAVKNSELSKALLKGYLNVLPPARFPAAFIFIKINNSLVDINVHPRKEEVKFVKPVTVKNKLQLIVKTTLENNLSRSLDIQTFESQNNSNNSPGTRAPDTQNNLYNSFGAQTFDRQAFTKVIDQLEPADFTVKQPSLSEPAIINSLEEKQNTELNQFSDKSISNNHSQVNKVNKDIAQLPSFGRVLAQLFRTYILVQNQDNLILIDQHAAHERILYEKFLNKFEKKEGTRLMFPELVKLSPEQLKTILKEKEFFSDQGIEIEQFAHDQIAIKTSPPKIQNNDLKELIFEVLQFIEDNEQLEKELFRKKLNEHMHAQLSCKMAVKAGDLLDFKEMEQLIEDLQKTDNRFICAHGRPTTWSVSKGVIEKNFRRK